jgi:hypothetical protein
LLREVVPDAYQRRPGLVRRHEIEILSLAPELRGKVDAALETLTSLAVPDERTRFYGPGRTLRLAHGVVELFNELAEYRPVLPLTIWLENVHAADPIEQELIAIWLRRADPERVRLVVATTPPALPPELQAALANYANRIDAAPLPPPIGGDDEALARAYVESDGTSDLPAPRAAYERTAPSLRAIFHDQRAQALERGGN